MVHYFWRSGSGSYVWFTTVHHLAAVLRIHWIMMRIWPRIWDPHWKKIDPDPGHEHLSKLYFKNFLIIFHILFYLFLCNILINHSEISTFLIISLFWPFEIWVLRTKYFFFAVFGCYFALGSRLGVYIFSQ